jgi:hypothetical protein
LKFCIQKQVNFEKELLNSNRSKSKLEFVSFVSFARQNFVIKKAPHVCPQGVGVLAVELHYALFFQKACVGSTHDYEMHKGG